MLRALLYCAVHNICDRCYTGQFSLEYICRCIIDTPYASTLAGEL